MTRSKTKVVWSGKNLTPDLIQVLRACCVASIASISRYCSQDVGSDEWKRRRNRMFHLLNALDGEGYTCEPPETELSDDAIIVCINGTCISEADANLLGHAVKLYGEGSVQVALTYTGYSAKHYHNLAQELLEPVLDRILSQTRANWEDCDEPIPE